jgi:prevent-host-death family protein
MAIFPLTRAIRDLSRLIEVAHSGEEVIISKAGKPVARLLPYMVSKKQRRLGILKGKIEIAPDFDDELVLVPASVFRDKIKDPDR